MNPSIRYLCARTQFNMVRGKQAIPWERQKYLWRKEVCSDGRVQKFQRRVRQIVPKFSPLPPVTPFFHCLWNINIPYTSSIHLAGYFSHASRLDAFPKLGMPSVYGFSQCWRCLPPKTCRSAWIAAPTESQSDEWKLLIMAGAGKSGWNMLWEQSDQI